MTGARSDDERRSTHDDVRDILGVLHHLLGVDQPSSGTAAMPPVVAAVPVSTPAGPVRVGSGPAGHQTPGARRSEGKLVGARPDQDASGSRDDPTPGTAVDVRAPAPTAVPTFCPTCDDAHYGECPALTLRRRSLTHWLLDRIGRPA